MQTQINGQIVTYTLTYDEIDAYAAQHAAECDFDPEFPDWTDDHLNAGSPTVVGQINHFGLSWDNDKREVTFVTYATTPDQEPDFWINHQFEGLRAVTHLVAMAYEHKSPAMIDWGPMLPDLGGDDDVDYNGSYYDVAFDVIHAMLTAK